MQVLTVVVLFWLCAFGLHDAYQASVVLGAIASAILAVGAYVFARGR